MSTSLADQFAGHELLSKRYSALPFAFYRHGPKLLHTPEEASVIAAIQSYVYKDSVPALELSQIAERAFISEAEVEATLHELENRGLLWRSAQLDLTPFWSKLDHLLREELTGRSN